jgi:hypothetical protein
MVVVNHIPVEEFTVPEPVGFGSLTLDVRKLTAALGRAILHEADWLKIDFVKETP